MATTALSVVLDEIEHKRASIAHALIDGAARDFTEYKYMTGEIQGLSLAHSYINDLVRNLENDDE